MFFYSILFYIFFRQIEPADTTSFTVFVRYGRRPTLTRFDAKQTVTKDASEVVLLDDVIRKPGTYFVGILYDEGTEEQKRRMKRSCTGGGRQKRSCVQPKDPPQLNSIGRIVTPVYEPGSDMNYSLSGQEDKCLFWNSTVEQWSSQGCRVSAYCRIILRKVFCECVIWALFCGQTWAKSPSLESPKRIHWMITKKRITNMTVLRQDTQNFKFVLKTDITAPFCSSLFPEYGQSACCKFPTACKKKREKQKQ